MSCNLNIYVTTQFTSCTNNFSRTSLMTALNEALTTEVQRLKLATAELNGDTSKFQQLSINPQLFQLRHQQAMHQSQQQQQQQQQHSLPKQQSNGNSSTKHEQEP